VKQLDLPTQQNKETSFIYEGHEQFTQETKTCYYQILKILMEFGFKLIAKTNDKNNLIGITENVKLLLSLIPE
jgi:hypothetical protein